MADDTVFQGLVSQPCSAHHSPYMACNSCAERCQLAAPSRSRIRAEIKSRLCRAASCFAVGPNADVAWLRTDSAVDREVDCDAGVDGDAKGGRLSDLGNISCDLTLMAVAGAREAQK